MNRAPVSRSAALSAILLAVPVGVVLLLLIMLGNWQIARLAWKQDLLATIDQRIHNAPVPLSAALDRAGQGDDLEYQPVRVRGIFDHSRERHFLATWQGQSGFYLYTPLVLPQGEEIFINRGFVPYDLKDPASRPDSLVAGPLAVEGLLRRPLTEKPSFIVPDNDPAQNVFYWKDLEAMAGDEASTPREHLIAFFIDQSADAQAAPRQWPVGGVTRIDLPNNHLQYALTWYGLAATLVVVTAVFVIRQMRERVRQGEEE